MDGWRTMANWAAAPHPSSVCICPCLLWPSSLASFQLRKARWGVDRDRQVRDRQWWAPAGAYSLFTSLRFPSTCCSSFSFVSSYLSPPASELWEQKISVEVLLSGDSFNVGFGICYCDLLVFTLAKESLWPLFVLSNLQSCTVWSTCKGRDDYCHIVGQFLSENSTSWKQSNERTFYFCMVASRIICPGSSSRIYIVFKCICQSPAMSVASTFEGTPVAAPGIYVLF